MTYDADDATLVVKAGVNATGKDQIRRAFVAIAEYFKHSIGVKQGGMTVVEGGNTALVFMETMLHTKDDNGDPSHREHLGMRD